MDPFRKAALEKRIDEAGVFTNRFGSFNKSDYELLMFTVYLDSQRKTIRDYDISIELGIPESKVRSLRLKSQLLYPREIDWIKEVKKAIESGYYDESTRKITITIEDPFVKNLIKNKVEEGYGTVGISLNSKHLVLPIESFLLLAAEAEKKPSEVYKKLNELVKKEIKGAGKIEKGKMKKFVLKDIPNLATFLAAASTFYSTAGEIITALRSIIS